MCDEVTVIWKFINFRGLGGLSLVLFLIQTFHYKDTQTQFMFLNISVFANCFNDEIDFLCFSSFFSISMKSRGAIILFMALCTKKKNIFLRIKAIFHKIDSPLLVSEPWCPKYVYFWQIKLKESLRLSGPDNPTIIFSFHWNFANWKCFERIE